MCPLEADAVPDAYVHRPQAGGVDSARHSRPKGRPAPIFRRTGGVDGMETRQKKVRQVADLTGGGVTVESDAGAPGRYGRRTRASPWRASTESRIKESRIR